MRTFAIVAHRGIPEQTPENTLQAFQAAIDRGADAVEMDIRLTADSVPIVYHYTYLDEITDHSGPLFTYTAAQIRRVRVRNPHAPAAGAGQIPTFAEILAAFAGQIGLEIEIKGPEPESAEIISRILKDFRRYWDTFEITSYEPALLLEIRRRCPGIATDLLFPRSEEWMKLDVVAYQALHRARLARVRAVHLHPDQLTREVVTLVRKGGIEIHAWDVNDRRALEITSELGIPKICTDRFDEAFAFRERCEALQAIRQPSAPEVGSPRER
ncbi:MAG: hypothetical protein JXB85_11900 [Anaerolineales bacterium]|nr:hypothetical protein [Anaerolineales bacterium]